MLYSKLMMAEIRNSWNDMTHNYSRKETTIMAKTQEELNKIKEEIESLNKKLAELTEEELKQFIGGIGPDNGMVSDWCPFCGCVDFKKDESYRLCDREIWHCGKCGDLTHFLKDGHWEHGIILD